MAEPAHRLDDEEPIYDESGTTPSSPKPDLKALEGGGQTTEPKRGHLREAGAGQPSRQDLSSAEESSGESGSQVNHVYRPDNLNELTKIKPSAKGVLGFARANRGKVIIGGSATGLITLLIIGFFALAPFKILHIVNNLQSHFFASGENAVSKESDALFSSYVRNYVLPGLNSCKGSTIDKSCTPKAIQGNNIISKLYQGWTNGRLENTMAAKYGMEFKKVGTSFYLKMPGMDGNGANLDSFVHPDQQQLFNLDDYLDKSKDPQFKKVSRSELRQAYRDALGNETKWKQVMYRYKVGGLLSRKYGLKRCVVACTARDNFADWKDNKTKAAKMILAERVLGPRSEVLSIVVQCVISNDAACDPNNTTTGSDGRKQSVVQTRLQNKLTELAVTDTGRYVDVLAHSQGILKDGYKKYLVKQLVIQLGGKEASDITAEKAATLVPVIGWITTASNTVYSLEHAGPKIKAFSYMTNAAAMVGLYTTYRVLADECKTGNCDPAILGSFTNQLGTTLDKTATGGTAGAEQAPLYPSLIDGDPASQSGSETYRCNDGKLIPAGQHVCQEEVLGGSSSTVTGAINGALGAIGPLKNLADFWNNTAGFLMKKIINAGAFLFDSILSKVSLFNQLENLVTGVVGPIISYFTDLIFPSPFSDNMGGGRTFDLMAGGADVSGNDYAQNELGGKALSSQQAAAIFTEQNQQGIQQYKSESFFARMFDTTSNYSLASRVAMAMPISWSSSGQTISSIFSDPFGKLSHSFASLFSFNRVFAAATPQADPFGITQYGYTNADIQNIGDPEAYWANHCSSDGTTLDWSDNTINGQWQNSAISNPDPNTGLPESTSTDPCLLIQSAVGSAGALYNPSLLTSDDQAAN